jgi:hypothetical protein
MKTAQKLDPLIRAVGTEAIFKESDTYVDIIISPLDACHVISHV